MTTFASSSKSNRLLQGKRYTIAQFDGQEAYTNVTDINSGEIYIQQDSLPSTSLPYSGSEQDNQTILSGSDVVARYFYRMRLTPGNVETSGKYQTWFAISGSDGTADTPQLVNADQTVNWISNKYMAAAEAAKVAEATDPGDVGYNVVISKGASAGAADPLSVNDYQFDYKTGVVQFVSTALAPTTSEVIYISGYVYEGKTLNQHIASGSSGGSGAGFPFSGSAVITGSLLVSGSGDSKTISIIGNVSASEGFTGSLHGTSLTASYVETAQTASYVETAQTASYVETAQTASYVLASSIDQPFTNITASGNISSSGQIKSAGLTASAATFESASVDHLTVTTLVSGSVIITSGSNVFGDSTLDTQTLIGTVKMSGSAQVTGSTSISGTLSLPGINDVSASIHALAIAEDQSGIFEETGVSGVFAATSSLQITGSTLLTSPNTDSGANITSSNAGTNGGQANYAMVVSESVWHYNANVGVPFSNAWGTGLDGSFFENFDQNTNISEMLRFVAGLLSSSAPNTLPNTNTYSSIAETKGSTGGGATILGRVPQSATETTVAYLEGKGFAADGNTIFQGIATADGYKGNSGFNIKYSSVSSGNTLISSSDSFSNGAGNTKLIGLGTIGGALQVSGSLDFRFSDNASNTETATSHSSATLTNSTIDSTSDGLTLATIISANPAVIPNSFQDGLFTDVFQANLFNNGVDLSTKESVGYYEISSSLTFKTGSGTFLPVQTATERILYSPIADTDIANNSLTLTNASSASVGTPVSRSLSGAPYLITTDFKIGNQINNLFNPLYIDSTTAAFLEDSATLVTMSAPSNHNFTLSTNGGTISTSDVVFPNGGGTARGAVVPTEDDIIIFSASLAFNAGTANQGNTNIAKSSLNPTQFTVSTFGRTRKQSSSTTTLRTDTFNIFGDGEYGQPADSGSMAYYGLDQGGDNGSLTGTTEEFSGESFRLKIDNNLLVGTYAAGTKFTTGSYDVYNLDKYDLQVKPGFLVVPGGSNKYWLNAHPTSTSDYKYYARVFQTDGGTKGALALNVGQTLNEWSSTSNGISALVMFQAAATGIDTGGGALARPKLYDFATLTGTGNIASDQGNDDHLNPFTTNIDIGKNNQAGSGVSSFTYTMPLTQTLNQVLNSTYTNYVILIRYKGVPTNTLDSSTYRITVSYP